MQPYVASKQWRDGFGNRETRITAADLNHMEAGISAATQGVTSVEGQITSLRTSVTSQVDAAKTAILEAAKALVPLGIIVPFAGTREPENWLLCQGQILKRDAFPVLFQLIGTHYGHTDASNFRIPDLRNRFLTGAGGQYTLGVAGGADTVTLTVQQMPGHTHDIGGKADAAGNDGVGMYVSNLGAGTGWQALSTREAGSKSGLVAKSTGGGQAHENRPPYFAVNYIMKVR